jgi:hypothetical protein
METNAAIDSPFGGSPDPKKKERVKVEVLRALRRGGKVCEKGAILELPGDEARELIACGKIQYHPPPPPPPEPTKEERHKALNAGPVKVKITRPCRIKGFVCTAGEVVSLDEEAAGDIVGAKRGEAELPPPEESLDTKVARLVKNTLDHMGGRRK